MSITEQMEIVIRGAMDKVNPENRAVSEYLRKKLELILPGKYMVISYKSYDQESYDVSYVRVKDYWIFARRIYNEGRQDGVSDFLKTKFGWAAIASCSQFQVLNLCIRIDIDST